MLLPFPLIIKWTLNIFRIPDKKSNKTQTRQSSGRAKKIMRALFRFCVPSYWRPSAREGRQFFPGVEEWKNTSFKFISISQRAQNWKKRKVILAESERTYSCLLLKNSPGFSFPLYLVHFVIAFHFFLFKQNYFMFFLWISQEFWGPDHLSEWGYVRGSFRNNFLTDFVTKFHQSFSERNAYPPTYLCLLQNFG